MRTRAVAVTREVPPLVIVEDSMHGHRLQYVRRLACYAAQHDMRTVLVAPAGTTVSDEFVRQIGERSLQVVEIADVPAGHLVSVSGRVRLLDAAVRLGPHRVVLPSADQFLLPLLMVFLRRGFAARCGWPAWRLLLMRFDPAPPRQWRPLVARVAKAVLVVTLRVLDARVRVAELVLDEEPRPALSRMLGLDRVPDVVEFTPRYRERAAARSAVGLDPDAAVLLVPGDISSRKCVPELLDAWGADAPGVLVLAGRLDESVRALLQERGELHPLLADGRVVVRDLYLASEELDDHLVAADVVALLYRNVGSSGIYLKARAAGRHVLAFGNPVVVRAVERDGSGTIVPSLEPRGLAAAIRRAFVAARAHGEQPHAQAGRATFEQRLMGSLPGGQR